MIRVLEINAVYKKGSTGVLMDQIGEVLQEDGMEVYYATPDAPVSKYTYQIGNRLDHKGHAVLCRLVGVQGYFSNIATAKLIRWIDRIKPDIIHLHNLHSNYINYTVLLSYIQKRRIKTIITLHDCWFFTGKCFHFLYDDCLKWQENCGRCPRKRKEQASLVFDFSKKVLADKKRLIGDNANVQIVAVSEWLAAEARKSILRNRPISVIRNGIDLGVFQPQEINRAEKNIQNDEFVLLVMANKWFAPENANSVKELLDSLETGMRVIVIGCNENQASCDVKVTCLGRLNAQQLAQYYSLADVFVNLTKVDSFPTVNMEAISCGTPVVTFDSGGSRESVLEGKTGYVVPYGNVPLLMDRIKLIRKVGKSAYIAECLKAAQMTFDKKKCFIQYLYLIKDMLNDGK